MANEWYVKATLERKISNTQKKSRSGMERERSAKNVKRKRD